MGVTCSLEVTEVYKGMVIPIVSQTEGTPVDLTDK
jgi:hypothetical protein